MHDEQLKKQLIAKKKWLYTGITVLGIGAEIGLTNGVIANAATSTTTTVQTATTSASSATEQTPSQTATRNQSSADSQTTANTASSTEEASSTVSSASSNAVASAASTSSATSPTKASAVSTSTSTAPVAVEAQTSTATVASTESKVAVATTSAAVTPNSTHGQPATVASQAVLVTTARSTVKTLKVTATADDVSDFNFSLNTAGTAYTVTGYTGARQKQNAGGQTPASGYQTAITIPDTYNGHDVTSIADNAFNNDGSENDNLTIVSALTAVTFGKNIQTIGANAFQANQLTAVSLPDSAWSIGDNAFADNKITTVTLPAVTQIGASAFANNAIKVVDLPTQTWLIGASAFANNQLTTVTFPGVTVIGASAFANNQLSGTLMLPAALTTIGNQAFLNNALTGLTMGAAVSSIGTAAFAGNQLTGTLSLPDTLTSIGDQAFLNNQLTTLTLGQAIKTIGDSAFAGNQLAGTLVVPATLTTIGDQSFYQNDLTQLILGSSVKSIGTSAFANNQLSGTLVLSAGLTDLGDAAFENNDLTQVSFGSQLAEIKAATFANNALTGTLTLNNGLTTIDEQAFYNNILTGLVLGADVTTIGTSAFEENQLTGQLILDNALTTVADRAFYGNQLTELTLGRSVNTLGVSAFEDNQLTGNLILDVALVTINKRAFYDNQLTGLTFNQVLTMVGTLAFADNKLTGALALPTSLVTVETGAFETNQITSISFGGLTTINDAVFSHNKLNVLVIPAGITYIGNQAFEASGVTALTLGAGVTSIGTSAFANDNISGTLNLPSTLLYIGDQAFTTNYLAALTGGTAVKTIGTESFANNQLTQLSLADSVTDIGQSAFENNHLTTLQLGRGLNNVSERAFANNDLQQLNATAAVNQILTAAFAEQTTLTVTVAATATTAVGIKAALIAKLGLNNLDLAGLTLTMDGQSLAYDEATDTLTLPITVAALTKASDASLAVTLTSTGAGQYGVNTLTLNLSPEMVTAVVDIPSNLGVQSVNATGEIGRTIQITVPVETGYTADKISVAAMVNPDGTIITDEVIVYTGNQVTSDVMISSNLGNQLVRSVSGQVGSTVSVTIPVVTGYTADKTSITAVVNSDGTITTDEVIVYTGNQVTGDVMISSNLGNQLVQSVSGQVGSTVSVTIPVETGYTADKTSVAAMVNPDGTITTDEVIVYTGNQVTNDVTISSNLGNQLVRSVSGQVGSTVSVTIPVVTGYTADKTSVAAMVNPDGTITTDEVIVYTGNQVTNDVTISSNLGNQLVRSVSGQVGSTVSVTIPVVTGYTADKTSVTAVVNPDGTITIDEVIVYTGNQVTNDVTISSNLGNQLVQSVSGQVGTAIEVVVPIMAGYTADKTSVVAMVNANGTITTDEAVVYMGNQVTGDVTISSNLGDQFVQSVNGQVGGTVLVSVPAVAGYTVDKTSVVAVVHADGTITTDETIVYTGDPVTGDVTIDSNLGHRVVTAVSGQVGSTVLVIVPDVAGYAADKNKVMVTVNPNGTMTTDETIVYTGNRVINDVTISSNLGHRLIQAVSGQVGRTVSINVPVVFGYTANKTSVTAVVNANGTITTDEAVVYTGNQVTSDVIINSNLGNQLVPAVTGQVGGTVLVSVPAVADYTADKTNITAIVNPNDTITTKQVIVYTGNYVTGDVLIRSNQGNQYVTASGRVGAVIQIAVPNLIGYTANKTSVTAMVNTNGTITTSETISYTSIQVTGGVKVTSSLGQQAVKKVNDQVGTNVLATLPRVKGNMVKPVVVLARVHPNVIAKGKLQIMNTVDIISRLRLGNRLNLQQLTTSRRQVSHLIGNRSSTLSAMPYSKVKVNQAPKPAQPIKSTNQTILPKTNEARISWRWLGLLTLIVISMMEVKLRRRFNEH
ncbi:hypothetical protein C5Z25_00535 [Lactobacillus sp. CBA3605]|uniref:beta strand repeat-containing protein n=1 Tax=Lactobacillus sp. CBA3605 TaxID=2099788 RepID=UPI000CFCFA0F|nr:leucine-rich repeat domain-containing protein [Lactobacillus sp. CBA3605]AVK60354.1 hypothetical protein C5Z25_00535 [Lactobacillus sp. CBA3605]